MVSFSGRSAKVLVCAAESCSIEAKMAIFIILMAIKIGQSLI